MGKIITAAIISMILSLIIGGAWVVYQLFYPHCGVTTADAVMLSLSLILMLGALILLMLDLVFDL